jgi:hypothetical protein
LQLRSHFVLNVTFSGSELGSDRGATVIDPPTLGWKKCGRERELIDRALIDRANAAKLLQQIEQGLEHSREIIAQINNVLAQRRRLLLAQRNPGRACSTRAQQTGHGDIYTGTPGPSRHPVNRPLRGAVPLFPTPHRWAGIGQPGTCGKTTSLTSYVLGAGGLLPLLTDGVYLTADIYDFATGQTGAVGAVSATPLPTALPLFATGLGALGLLGWLRKRKAQATCLARLN